MLNYIKAEVYRNFNRMYFWMFTIILSGFPLVLNIVGKVKGGLRGLGLTEYMDGIVIMLSVPVFIAIVFIDMTTAEEHKNLTLRNVVTFGLNRTKIVLSKFIVSTILAVSSGAIILTITLGSGTILFGLGSNFPGDIKMNIIKVLVASVLWGGAISVGIFLALVVKNNNAFSFIYIMIFMFFNLILKMLIFFKFTAFKYLYDVLITTQLSVIKQQNATNHDLGTAALIGVIYILVFLALSAVYFNKQEVK